MLPTIDEYPARYQYRFCPLDATLLVRGLVHDCERLYCPQCGWVWYPLPQIAATVIIEYQGGIVLAQRALPPDAGIWHLPIGHVEFGETPEAAAIREAAEETGLIVGDLRFLTYEVSPSYADPRMPYIVFGFVGCAIGGTLHPTAESTAVQVVPLADLPPLKWSSQQKTLAAYRAGG
ncbi:MAG: NUDIX hydrolase [Chloroflexaceae bacterium]|nr:NUDIX hydrolase [Chloroflexaceae bacterium]NJO04453.1 NUDIX hydrolase [Chloroflexaceae bacterium]